MNKNSSIELRPHPFARYGVVTVSHKTASVEVREQIAVAANDLPAFLRALKALGMADEIVVLSTCGRTEIYFATGLDPTVVLAALDAVLEQRLSRPIKAYARGFAGRAAVVHAFRVVSSLESLVLGETGIVQQFSDAYAAARAAGMTGRWLNRLFQTAQSVNKSVRSGTTIQEGNASVAGLAAQQAARTLGDLGRAQVLVVGAGETAETAARALKRHGAGRFVVCNRTPVRAEELAAKLGGSAASFESWTDLLSTVDIVVVATAAPNWLLTHPQLEKARSGSIRPQVVLDLSVPRNVDSFCASLPGVTLLDVDGLETEVKRASLLRENQRPLAESIIAERTDEFAAQLERSERYLRDSSER
ncbi:MAG: glutamyl-tRNA reductase [Verrucomicrobiae bacterium]|nr:glutamyl-tRNA reductase [Verrucomicrobiae bacterium]